MSRPPTPKQIAYLTYMGVGNAPEMSFDQASASIEGLLETGDQKQFERIHDKKTRWISDRLVLHPDLYAAEIKTMLSNELPDALHNYVRSRMVGASEKLTKAKISSVISTLQADSPVWWQAENRDEVFFYQLSVSYPGCVDGQVPERKAARPSNPKTAANQKGSGCLILLAALPLGLSAMAAYLITKG